uniref:Uncharacterized protein n=1 Tax=Panagrolaimus superbus TaxID=310955 RepID=A0A914Y9Z6_9BILA
MNMTVLLMMACNTFLEIIPFGAALWYNWITGLQIQGIIGPYAVTGNTTVILFSVLFYYKASKMMTRNGSQIKVAPAATGTPATTSTKDITVAITPAPK